MNERLAFDKQFWIAATCRMAYDEFAGIAREVFLDVDRVVSTEHAFGLKDEEPGVLLRAVRNRLVKPRVVAARGHAEDATHRPRAVPVSMRFDEFVR